MKTYYIFTRTNEHPRTINTPMMGRVNYTKYEVIGREALDKKVKELNVKGEHISEVRTALGTKVWP